MDRTQGSTSGALPMLSERLIHTLLNPSAHARAPGAQCSNTFQTLLAVTSSVLQGHQHAYGEASVPFTQVILSGTVRDVDYKAHAAHLTTLPGSVRPFPNPPLRILK